MRCSDANTVVRYKYVLFSFTIPHLVKFYHCFDRILIFLGSKFCFLSVSVTLVVNLKKRYWNIDLISQCHILVADPKYQHLFLLVKNKRQMWRFECESRCRFRAGRINVNGLKGAARCFLMGDTIVGKIKLWLNLFGFQ